MADTTPTTDTDVTTPDDPPPRTRRPTPRTWLQSWPAGSRGPQARNQRAKANAAAAEKKLAKIEEGVEPPFERAQAAATAVEERAKAAEERIACQLTRGRVGCRRKA